jgi:hypothetical protein
VNALGQTRWRVVAPITAAIFAGLLTVAVGFACTALARISLSTTSAAAG